MNDINSDKTFMIQAYYDDLEKRIAFLKELYNGNHTDEALMLCCCYIEALGNRQYNNLNKNAKNYYRILVEFSGNNIFALVHPKQLKNVLEDKKLFRANIDQIAPIVDGFGKELIPRQEVFDSLAPVVTEDQMNWLNDNVFKGTMAAISYDRVRSDLVHAISTSKLTFSETTFDGKPVPDMNFELLYPALMKIFDRLKEMSLKTNTWYWEQ
jgi:hypothetical protein